MQLNDVCRSLIRKLDVFLDGEDSVKCVNPHCQHTDNLCSEPAVLLHHGQSLRLAYQEKQISEKRTTVHIGQRKLLMSEIGALMGLERETEYLVVYAGAAPGNHIPYLADLFPHMTFHLYDPRPFSIRASDRIQLYNAYFTDATAEQYTITDLPLVFISDIRRDIQGPTVWGDMLMQQDWHLIMKPVLTSLKFRLPWPNEKIISTQSRSTRLTAPYKVEYLAGDIHLPIWGRQSTTECRLVIHKARHEGKRTYDCLAYEEEMSYFNKKIRPCVHTAQKVRTGGLDACFDCAAEVALLRRYAEWNKEEPTDEYVSKMSAEITSVLGRPLTAGVEDRTDQD